MKTCIWYHTADRNPETSGYYMAYRTVTLADDTCGVDYYYWNKNSNEWRTDSTCHSHWANVYYWTPEDPEQWVNSDVPVRKRKTRQKSNPALDIAWQKVEQAVAQYELIKALVGSETHE